MTEAVHVKPGLPRDVNDNHVDVKNERRNESSGDADSEKYNHIQLVIPEPKRLTHSKVALGLDDISGGTFSARTSDREREGYNLSPGSKPIYPYPSYPWPLPFLPGIPAATGYPFFPYPSTLAAGYPYHVIPEHYNQLRHLPVDHLERCNGNLSTFPYMFWGSGKIPSNIPSPSLKLDVKSDVENATSKSPVITDGESSLPTDLSINKSRCALSTSPATVAMSDSDKKKSKPSEQAKYQCSGCDKNYSTFSGLSKHKQFHCIQDNKKEFTCKYCDKCYVSLGALKMHIRTHTLPCKCKICGKAFSRPWLLQGHVRTHTGEKPFTCVHCLRAFADRSNLRAHLQTHSDVKKYSCKTCSKTFSRMSLLLKHEESCARMC